MVRQDKPIHNTYCVGIRYIVKNEDCGTFDDILASNMITKFNCGNKRKGWRK